MRSLAFPACIQKVTHAAAANPNEDIRLPSNQVIPQNLNEHNAGQHLTGPPSVASGPINSARLHP